MIRINVSRADATLTETETLTEGRVGLRCAFTFGEEWNGLQKIAYFQGADEKSVAMVDGDEVEVPWECLVSAGYKLNVGVRGDNASGDTVIPTVWVRAGKIVPSPDGGIPEGEEPTPSVVAQIQQAAANALLIASGVREDADSGAFAGPQGPQGPQGITGDTGPGASVVVTEDTDFILVHGQYQNMRDKHVVDIQDNTGSHTFTVRDPYPLKLISNKSGGKTSLWFYTDDFFPVVEVKDGEPPAVTVEETYYGNKVTFTDGTGPHTINVFDGMTDTVKAALLDLFQHVAYIDGNGQQYYDALYDAFNPVLNVEYITVAFDPGTAVIYNTYELAQLKPYLTVTAHYDDDTTAVVNNYTLSGTLAPGTSVITVSYGGKSAMFTVNVAEWLTSITAVFTQGSAVIYDTDSLDTLKQYLTVTANYADGTSATVSDYELNGSLTIGTSTIAVSYGGKTDTFNVTVTDHRHLPTDYTWLYEAKDGVLLRNFSSISYASTNGTVDERLENGYLYIATNGNIANAQYKLVDETTTDGILSVRAKLLSGAGFNNTLDGRCIELTLSNGTNGALSDFYTINDGIVCKSWFGNNQSDGQKYSTGITADDFHVFTIKFQNGTQSTEIDGQPVFSNSTPSGYYTALNRFMVQNMGTVVSSVLIDWIAYKEN